MGSVWLADHLSLGNEVAVKFLAPELLAKDSTLVERFKREAALAAKINCPHVVQVLDHGLTDGGLPYIVMERLKGENLGQRLERSKRLSMRETGIILSQVAVALTAAHSIGVVHRDIKPDNIFLVESGYELFIKVLDFGIAKQAQPTREEVLTRTDSVMGTPEYMSPEQLLSTKNVDFRADLWPLAVVVYEALTGDRPFNGETVTALSIAICKGAFRMPSAVEPSLPPALDQWFVRALKTDRSLRFDSAEQMARAFAEALEDTQLTLVGLGSAEASFPSLPEATGSSPGNIPSGFDMVGLTDDLATGAIVGKRQLWEPLGEGIVVAPLQLNTTQPGLRAFRTIGLLDSSAPHEAAVLAFIKQKQAAEEPTEAYYELRCLGGTRQTQPWPIQNSGTTPVEILLTWHPDETPRLFWKEQSGPKGEEVTVPADGWYTTALPIPSCD